jgi:hypothetical protein
MGRGEERGFQYHHLSWNLRYADSLPHAHSLRTEKAGGRIEPPVDRTEEMRYWVISEEMLMEALERCWNNEDPHIMMLELTANSEIQKED